MSKLIKWVSAFATFLLTSVVAAQGRPLKVTIVASTAMTAQDDNLRRLFEGMVSTIHRRNPRFPYTSIDFIRVSYETPCAQLENSTIGTLTPLKFLECNNASPDNLKPLFIVKKRGEPIPYYSAFFITGRNSKVFSLTSDAIKRIYLVHPNSASGYVAPLYFLTDANIITAPTEAAVKAKGWEIIKGGEQREVLARLQDDEHAIAAVGQFPGQDNPASAPVRLLLRYYSLPQDPVVISSDLREYEAEIKDWFTSIYSQEPGGTSQGASILAKSSSTISAILPFEPEHENAFAHLDRMRNKVRVGASWEMPNMDGLTIGQIWGIVQQVKAVVVWAVVVALIGWALALYRIGYRRGLKAAASVEGTDGSRE